MVSSLDATDGGPPQAVLGLATALSQAGQRCTIVTHRHAGRSTHPDVDQAQQAGVRIRWVPRKRPTRFQFSPRLMWAVRQEARASDVVTAHGFYQFTCVAAALAAPRAAFFFLQPHGVFEPYQEQVSQRTKRFFMFPVGRLILRRVNRIVAASPSEAVGFENSLGRRCPSILTAGLGVTGCDAVVRSPTVDRYRQRRVVFVSRIAAKKRVDKLLGAAAVLAHSGRPIELEFCGDGEAELVRGLKASQDPRVVARWHGHVVDPARAMIESQCALQCLPSDNENFGQAIAQAMARGLPIVTTTATAASAHVRTADAGWVLDDPTPADLAECLDAALSNPDDLLARANRGLTYAREHFDWATVADRWMAIAARGRAR